MLPKRWLGVCLLSSGLISVASFVHEEKQAHAAQDVIDLDEDSDEKVDKKSAPAAAVDAGPMSAEMTEAKKLFDAQKWDQAAPALFRVAAGESKDDSANQQL